MNDRIILTDRKCEKCGLFWAKNHVFGFDGYRKHVGYYHRCGASGHGKMDGNGPFERVGLDWLPQDWAEPVEKSRAILKR